MTHKQFKILVIVLAIAVILVSIVAFGGAFYFQSSISKTPSWDFQGAGAAAVVIPSFAGVVLAAVGIYFQARQSDTSRVTAERVFTKFLMLQIKTRANLRYLEILRDQEYANWVADQNSRDDYDGNDETDDEPPTKMQRYGELEQNALSALKQRLLKDLHGRSEFGSQSADSETQSHSTLLHSLAPIAGLLLERNRKRSSSDDQPDFELLEFALGIDQDCAYISSDIPNGHKDLMDGYESAINSLAKLEAHLMWLRSEKLLTVDAIELALNDADPIQLDIADRKVKIREISEKMENSPEGERLRNASQRLRNASRLAAHG